jgi:hypothetical protein
MRKNAERGEQDYEKKTKIMVSKAIIDIMLKRKKSTEALGGQQKCNFREQN